MLRIVGMSIAAALVGGGGSRAIHAQEQADAASDPVATVFTSWRTITATDGLPSDSIRALAGDGDRLWVGTDNGLALYDGVAWRSWHRTDGLPARRIQCLDVDRDSGDVWIGTLGGGLVRFTAGRFDSFNQFNSGIPGNLVFAVHHAAKKVYCLTNGGAAAFNPLDEAWEVILERRSDKAMEVPVDWRRAGELLMALLPDAELPSRAAGELRGLKALASDLESFPAKWTETSRQPQDGLRLCPEDGGPCVLHRQSTDGVTALMQLVQGDRILKSVMTQPMIPDNRVRCVLWERDRIWVGTANGLALGTTPRPWREAEKSVEVSIPPPPYRGARVEPHPGPTPPVRLAVLGPSTRRIALPGDEVPSRKSELSPDLLAVQLALEFHPDWIGASEAARPQIAPVPSGYANYGWGLPEDDLVGYADAPAVLGVIVGVSFPTEITSLAINTLEMPAVSIVPHEQVPHGPRADHHWVFHCYGSAPAQHRTLLQFVVKDQKLRRIALVYPHLDGTRHPFTWWRSHAHSLGLPTPKELPFEPDSPDRFKAIAGDLRDADVQVVFTWADGETTIKLLHALAEAGVSLPVVAEPSIMSANGTSVIRQYPAAVFTLSPASKSVDSPILDERTNSATESRLTSVAPNAIRQFTRKYASQNATRGRPRNPDLAAQLSFDAAQHLATAVRRSHGNRESVRTTLGEMETSAVGEEHYEAVHELGGTAVAVFDDGQWIVKTIPTQIAGRTASPVSGPDPASKGQLPENKPQ